MSRDATLSSNFTSNKTPLLEAVESGYSQTDLAWVSSEMLWFSFDNGFVDALVRGYRSQLITTLQYASLIQCETLEGTFILSRSTLTAPNHAPF